MRPLSDALDALAGDPDQITAYAQTWRNVAVNVANAGEQLYADVERDIAGWFGAAADAYRRHAGQHRTVLDAVARGCEAMAEVTTGVGLLVAMVREIVRDLIGEFVGVLAVRIWEWLAEAGLTLGAASPWVAAQVTTLAATWVVRISAVIRGLIASLRRIVPVLRRLGDLIGFLRGLLRRTGRGSAVPPVRTGPPSGVVLHSRSGALTNRQVLEQGVGLPRTREIVEHYASLAGVDLRGVDIDIVDAADDVTYLDFQGAVARTDAMGVQLGPAAFQDEETLVRTLGHESVHVQQYADGRVSSITGPLEDEAYAAEDGFVDAWRRSIR